ncbi:alpha/beta fold hydrolase [Actinokineospora enzanensis]|uniref:alpha/beta fold hydrolase n=1 Tax=Actinokineospora enzanensis TaxID=155975 RepID=UPI00037B9039|nr:alpha/beta hydrolase [Actinokineospora enzanensis]
MHSQLSSHSARAVTLGPLAALCVDNGGPYVVLVPGFTGSKEDFAPILDPIAEAGFSPVAIDLPGQLDSPGPADEAAYFPEPLGRVVAELVSSLDRPVILLGHSYGGLVVRRALLQGAQVAGLTLLSSGPGELPQGARRLVLDIGEPVVRAQGVVGAHRQMEVLNAANPRHQGLGDSVRTFLDARFLRNVPEALLGMSLGLRTEPDLVAELRLALGGSPCVVACGVDDDAWPPVVQRDMAERLDADFWVIRGAGHSPAVENPEGLMEILLPTWKSWLG